MKTMLIAFRGEPAPCPTKKQNNPRGIERGIERTVASVARSSRVWCVGCRMYALVEFKKNTSPPPSEQAHSVKCEEIKKRKTETRALLPLLLWSHVRSGEATAPGGEKIAHEQHGRSMKATIVKCYNVCTPTTTRRYCQVQRKPGRLPVVAGVETETTIQLQTNTSWSGFVQPRLPSRFK